MRWASVSVAPFLCVAACGSASSGGGAPGGALSCAGAPSQGVAKVQGTLGGQTVDVNQSPASGAFSQLTTGEFDLPIGVTIGDAAVDVDPGGVKIHLMWTGLVSNGSSAGATGTITFPAGDPYAQMSLCAGSGSKIEPNDHGLAFVLQNLTLGPACKQAVAGELSGCWDYASP